MTITIRKAAFGGLATLGAAVLLAGCAAAPEQTAGPTDGAAASDFIPCMVSDSGGFDDRSFNQSGYEGLNQAADELGVTPITVQSASENDFAPNLTSLASQGCNLIVSVGFALSNATVEAAKANPDIEYVIIDDAADNDQDGQTDAPNIKPLLFDTAQAAFLGGYAAADFSTTKIVGTFGGQNFPTVSIFMDGFKQGVDYYNQEKGTSVTLLGWNGTDGLFTGGFVANDTARQTAQGLIDQNADVILPVGGPIYQSAAAAIRDSGKSIALLGVDADLTQTDPSVADLVLTSILKGIKVSTYETVLAAGKGEFDATPYIGTLENEGVGLAPFHDFESKISPTLQDELDAIKDRIVSGDLTVNSYLAG